MSKNFTIKTERIGFSKIGDRMIDLNYLTSGDFDKIIFDLSRLKFVTPSGLCYFIACIQSLSDQLGKDKLEIIMPHNNSTNNYLTRMKFLETLNLNDDNYININDCSQNLLELQKISMDSCDWKIAENLKTVLKAQLPVNNQDILEAVTYSLSEITDNTIRHSQSPSGGFICAQTYPTMNKLEICIIDSGIGIVGSLKSENNIHKDVISTFSKDNEFIEYALGKGVTSKSVNHSGEGLFFTSKFITENKGRMKVISGNGMLLIDDEPGIQLFDTEHHWQGTIVMLEFNLDVPVDVVDIFNREFPPDSDMLDLDDLF